MTPHTLCVTALVAQLIFSALLPNLRIMSVFGFHALPFYYPDKPIFAGVEFELLIIDRIKP